MSRTKPNEGKHIDDIIRRTVCTKHQAEKGDPCFKVYYDAPNNGDNERDLYGSAICNTRVLKAGFNGKITTNSLNRSVKASRHST